MSFTGDFSSLIPLRLLSRYNGEFAGKNPAASLLTTIWQKIHQAPPCSISPSKRVNDDTLPPYTHGSTMTFIDGEYHHLDELCLYVESIC